MAKIKTPTPAPVQSTVKGARDRWFDPDVFAAAVEAVRPATEPKKIAVGLDLGTNTGVSIAHVDNTRPFSPGTVPLILGQWDLSAGSYDSGGLRFLKLRHFLRVLNPDMIFFEQVTFTPSVRGGPSVQAIMARAMTSAEFFGALKGVLVEYAEEFGVPCAGLPIGAIKRRGTGRGNANKVDMINACNLELGTNFDPETYESTGVDNIADSAFCLLLGLEQFGA
jgi:hypothetical protein